MQLWDSYSIWECANLEGFEQGNEKGSRNKAIEIARKMKALGLDSETITKVTGLAPDDY